MSTQLYPTTHLTKEELLHLMTVIAEKLQILNRSENAPKTRFVGSLKAGARRDLIFDLYLRMIRFYKVADRMVSIDGSATNLKCLLVSADLLSTFFDQVFTKLPPNQIDTAFDDYHVAHHLTSCDVALDTATWRLVSDVARAHHTRHVECKKACQEQKAFRESFLKTQTDFDIDFEEHEADHEPKLLSIEEAVLIIQKLERKYQAISRRNYVRFVRERAAELHGQKAEIDATQAAIRIQARTRGYFARKMVREMRERELNVLNMTPESYIRKRCAERERKRTRKAGAESLERVQQVDNVPDLDGALELLRTHFFLAGSGEELLAEPVRADCVADNAVFRDACFRNIVSPLAALELDELCSQKEVCRVDGRQFRFDTRTFLTVTVCLPLSLATWHGSKRQHRRRAPPSRWLLLAGATGSGKTAWARAIARVCHVTHVHVSKSVVNQGKRRIYAVIRKLARQERRLIVSIDRIDALRKDPKQKGYTHRQMLLRTFLADLAATSATVIAMTKKSIDELDGAIVELFPLQVSLSNPTDAVRYDLAVDCLSRNMEQDRLAKFPRRMFDIEKQTHGFTHAKTAKFVTNRWSAANNKTNLS